MTTRVRFAPSPTGYLHIGGARTALFNWLYARQTNGTFLLRIEDTDLERSSEEMVAGILEGLSWLGLGWDEGPYFQSRRLDRYRDVCRRLLDENQAYRCFCTPDELHVRKQAAQDAGAAWQYDKACRNLSDSEIQSRLQSGRSFALRFKVPSQQRVCFQDRVFGTIEVQSDHVEDFVILRSDGMPTYHLCVVADDVEMKISDVIRGADHLPNTSKHILLYQALKEPMPRYVHLPLILGPDKKRLSKRHGATSTLEYRRQGFLADALVNYLALLGWSPGEDREIFSRRQLIELFDLDRINKSNAVFDFQKLEWMNGQYITAMRAEDLEPEVKSVLEQQELWDPAWTAERRAWFLQVIDLLKSRVRKLTDFSVFGKAFFSDQFGYEPEAVSKYWSMKEPSNSLPQVLQELKESYQPLESFDLETTEKVLREMAERHRMKAGALIGAVRVALTGRSVAPGLFEVMITLGKERTLDRLDRAVRFLKTAL